MMGMVAVIRELPLPFVFRDKTKRNKDLPGQDLFGTARNNKETHPWHVGSFAIQRGTLFPRGKSFLTRRYGGKPKMISKNNLGHLISDFRGTNTLSGDL
jgi:hypothetical protein